MIFELLFQISNLTLQNGLFFCPFSQSASQLLYFFEIIGLHFGVMSFQGCQSLLKLLLHLIGFICFCFFVIQQALQKSSAMVLALGYHSIKFFLDKQIYKVYQPSSYNYANQRGACNSSVNNQEIHMSLENEVLSANADVILEIAPASPINFKKEYVRHLYCEIGKGMRLLYGDCEYNPFINNIEYESQQSLQFYQMQALEGYNVADKARCLAEHRLRARVIKDAFIRLGYIKKQRAVTRQIVKYSTLLSQKMLDKVKTEELKEFKQNVQEYCRQIESSYRETSNQVSGTFKSVNFSQMFSNLKDITKDQMRNDKKRRKTVQQLQKKLFISPQKPSSMIKQQQQRRMSPLVNSKLKEAIQKTKKKKVKARFHLNGKNINSQIVHILDKLQEIDSIEKLRNRRECLHEEEYQQYLHQRSKHLKRQKQRLSTAFENHQRHKFKPIGRIRREPSSKNENKYQLQQLSQVKKINRANQAVVLKPIKRSQIIISSSEISQQLINQEDYYDQKSIKYRSRQKNRRRGNVSLEELAIQREKASSNLQIVPQKNHHTEL